MLYKKKGIPEEDEVIICTVTKILPHSVFVSLNEYENKEGMIHISEISPGRIRNLRDFVREGKIIVCKVLRTDKERGHIDLSLRRVSLAQKKKKEEEFKQEEKAEKLLDLFGKENKLKLEEVYEKIGNLVLERFGSLNNFFQDVLKDEKSALKEFKTNKKLVEILIAKVKDKIKLPEVKLEATITISTSSEEGINKIKKSLLKADSLAKNKGYKINILYIGSPKYRLMIKSEDYKSAEKVLKEVSEEIIKEARALGCEAEWQKKS